MANYRWSICEPDQPKVIEKGSIPKDDIIVTFERFPWMDYLRMMAFMKESEINYSPSLEFENLDTKQGLVFSIAGNEINNEFYVFYKRPKTVKAFFGLSQRRMDDYTTDITGQTREDALYILTAFLNNNTEYLEQKIK